MRRGKRGYSSKPMSKQILRDSLAVRRLLEVNPSELKDDVVAKLSQKRQQHANEHARWLSALTADQVDVNALNAAADQKAQEMASTAKDIIIPALVKVHDTLTPAQRQKLADIIKSHHPQGGFGGPQE